MRTKRFGRVGASLLAAVAVFALLGACAAKSTTTTLSLYEREDQGFSNNLLKAAPNFSIGDRILEQHPLYTVDGNSKVGDDATAISVMAVYGKDPLLAIACQSAFGSDTVTWYSVARLSAVMAGTTAAITGGTGKYKGASGTVFVKGNKRGGKDVFDETYTITVPK